MLLAWPGLRWKVSTCPGQEGLPGQLASTDGSLEEILLQHMGDWLEAPQAEGLRPGRRWVMSDTGEGKEQWMANYFSLVG